MERESGPRADFVVLTALPLEYAAVRRHLTALSEDQYRGTLFEIGTLPGVSGRIALAVTGMGNQSAAALAERALARFRPRALLLVGIAGGLADELALGDVVVATWVGHLHTGKETSDGFERRHRHWPASHALLQVAQRVAGAETWTERLPAVAAEPHPRVHFKPIVAGDVVLNAKSGLRAQIRQDFSEAVAIEMESAGVAEAAHLNAHRATITIRGISDLADGAKAASDRSGWQPTAAAAAAAFAMELIARAGPALTDSADRPRVRRRIGIVVSSLLLFLAVTGWVALGLGIDAFYEAMGVDPSIVQIGVGKRLQLVWLPIIALVFVVGLAIGACLLGASIVPARGRAKMPGGALIILGATTSVLGIALIPDLLIRDLALFAIFCVLLGTMGSPTAKPHRKYRDIGFWSGIGISAFVVVLLVFVNGRLPTPWPAVLFLGSLLAAVVALGWWLRVEVRDGGPVERVSPVRRAADLLASLPMVNHDLRTQMPRWQATGMVVILLATGIGVSGWAVLQLIDWLDERSAAGQAAVEHGYVPEGWYSSLLPLDIQPVTITLRRSGVDPMAVCQGTLAQSASLVERDRDTAWVLLRSPGPGLDSAQVLPLSVTDYLVQPVPDEKLPVHGQPWTGPACAAQD